MPASARGSPPPAEALAVGAGAPPEPALTVHLARTGRTLQVQPDQTLLQAVRSVGVDVPYVCLEGKCGACEVGVLGGTPEHRDPVYANTSRLPRDRMKLCVSRSLTPRLTLDL
ncbi:MAG: hypothetical protein CVU36_09375 [Betaproteobacteria bacterium HGW-Betaproteobacteria-9]|nr:MAG: hypothetical protein CVU36_09375 [Betaproteobacteria bacterium HGW-Betaproteobacteria-9]